ncbi:hypothetical protein [Actinokineospora terrae]|uniref:Uncharacterized protein n=1 Tax=Actinokineospora terrae TaxID=155974 RepID=A0A1H9S849_9PSEU|nr:hypothetical protein [Actinokineospora terrae]SER80359.1 hypothetical protein SAMN04487818_105288 [Actinokineospora terrae]
MTLRITTPPAADSAADASPGPRIGWAESPSRLRLAFAVAAAGAVAQVAGPLIGLVDASPAAAFASIPLLVLLAVLPPVVATALAVAGRPIVAAGVLVGAALLTPGRFLGDLQFLLDPLVVSRPEVMVPTSLAPLRAGAGLWVLLVGHLLVIAAGLMAANRAGAPYGTPYAAELDDEVRQRSAPLGLVAGVVAAFGLQLPPFTSGNAFLLAEGLIDSPWLLRFALLAAGAGVVAAALVGAGSRPSVARGVSVGAALGVLAITAPQIAAGLWVALLDAAPGPYVALLAAAGLAVSLWVTTRAHGRSEPVRIAGVLGLLAGLAGIAAGTTTVIAVNGVAQETYSNRLFLPAGILVAALALPLLFSKTATALRPAFAAALAAIPLAGMSTLDAVVTATAVDATVGTGAAVWFTAAAGALAAAAAVVALVAGNAERGEVEERPLDLVLVAPLAVAGLLAIGAFGLPVVKATGLVPPGIWTEFRLASLGLLLAALTVVVAVALTPLSRPHRAGALLLGCAGLVGVRVLEYPLTAARAAGSVPGPGLWLSLACTAALVVAGLMVLSRR